ncbi:MAG: hypothetical protein OK438_00905 [Thaumarchaeota archaeon]|nr:hypothetical protein [Nitrososphaerota archaeon]
MLTSVVVATTVVLPCESEVEPTESLLSVDVAVEETDWALVSEPVDCWVLVVESGEWATVVVEPEGCGVVVVKPEGSELVAELEDPAGNPEPRARKNAIAKRKKANEVMITDRRDLLNDMQECRSNQYKHLGLFGN